MARYIDADKAAMQATQNAQNYEPCMSEYEEGVADTWENAASFIKNFQSANVAPVIHAKWENIWFVSGESAVEATCSNCKKQARKYRDDYYDSYTFDFCPNCAANMDGE